MSLKIKYEETEDKGSILTKGSFPQDRVFEGQRCVTIEYPL